MDLINRGFWLLRNKGLVHFIKATYNYFQRRIIQIRGHMNLSVGDRDVNFAANSGFIIYKTIDRVEKEKDVLKKILNEVNNKDVFYDIGANNGIYSCFVAKKCNQCQVVAFEPYAPNIFELNKNIELNDIKNISVFHLALSNESGTVSFSTPEDPTPGHGTGSITDDQNNESIQAVRGDELILEDKIPSPNIVKIDVEGSEPLVVDGLRNALSDPDCRLVLCELHTYTLSEFGSSTSDMIEEFKQMGYDVKIHSHNKDIKLIEARRE